MRQCKGIQLRYPRKERLHVPDVVDARSLACERGRRGLSASKKWARSEQRGGKSTLLCDRSAQPKGSDLRVISVRRSGADEAEGGRGTFGRRMGGQSCRLARIAFKVNRAQALALLQRAAQCKRTRTGLTPAHICAGTGPTAPTSAPGLGQPCHICARIGPTLPNLRQDWTRRLVSKFPCFFRCSNCMPRSMLHVAWHALC